MDDSEAYCDECGAMARYDCPGHSEYNGWSNWATWNAALWLDNDYLLYKASQGLDAEALQAFCVERWVITTPDGANLDHVDWEEVATARNNEDGTV